MDKLALEILCQIFFYACTDGGPTGCALALVSRRIHAASRPARFYSVALFTSPAKIEEFLRVYQHERGRSMDMLPRVRHLWLSYDENSHEVPQPSPPPVSPKAPTSRAEFLAILQRRAQTWRSAHAILDEQYNRVIPMLIRAVAADLESLALNQIRWQSTAVVRCGFPRLRELTLIGGDPNFLPCGATEESAVLYPKLQRLHHILTPIGKKVDFAEWTHHAPLLTHLRVSRLDYNPRITLKSLEQVIDDTSSEAFFPYLQQVIILPHPPPPADLQATSSGATYSQFLAHLHGLPEHCRVPVKVLPPFRMDRPYHGVEAPRECIVRLRGLWMERIEGGPGCWAEGQMEGPAPLRCSQLQPV
ncbi:hypothetical protein PYCCODRAFT_1429488 [Trametes coccinea BRFM310]|uniref:Uncharacterized protein n=1 Tax=Trametes coccinea (strain BRFM310) TaxID=1353009 RepID=A0A1Y2J4T1_TRAC3|nr:hypothetical protein PYCCODRAFT_1429488 [Trametes coccinea BRFM310]